jgi:hypothetical protein
MQAPYPWQCATQEALVQSTWSAHQLRGLRVGMSDFGPLLVHGNNNVSRVAFGCELPVAVGSEFAV